MKYARQPSHVIGQNFCTVHIATDDAVETGRTLCGKVPTVNEWDRLFYHEQPRWQFFLVNPNPDPEFLCKRCERAAIKRVPRHSEAVE